MKTVIYLTGHAGSGKSTVAVYLSALLESAPVIEVDDIKVERYKTTETCIPHEDFPEAGRLARLALEEHDRVIVVEAFGDEAHLAYVQSELPADVEVLKILLECHPGTAMKRKEDVLSHQTVLGQLARFQSAFPDRRTLDTTKATAEEVARQVIELVREIEDSTA